MAQKIKQEANTTTTDQRIAQLQSEVHQLRAILDEQSDQLAKQQKLMQLIQFSWLTFFFVVFNSVLLGLFVVIFIKDRGQFLALAYSMIGISIADTCKQRRLSLIMLFLTADGVYVGEYTRKKLIQVITANYM